MVLFSLSSCLKKHLITELLCKRIVYSQFKNFPRRIKISQPSCVLTLFSDVNADFSDVGAVFSDVNAIFSDVNPKKSD